MDGRVQGKLSDRRYAALVARFSTRIDSTLPAEQAFAYMASFEHAVEWDPSVTEARRLDDGPLRLGSAFQLVSRIGGRSIPLRYAITELAAPRRVALEVENRTFRGRDVVEVEPRDGGSTVVYDARIELRGAGRLLDPVLRVVFTRLGRRAEAGLRRVLNP